MMTRRGASDETQNHHRGEEEEEEKRFSSRFSPLVVKERCFDFTISRRKDDGDLATTTWDIPSGVDFHEWQRASALAKKDFEKKEEEKSKKDELAEEEERKSVVPRLSRPPHRVLETLEEEEEEEEEVWAKEEAVEEVLKDKRRHHEDAIQEKKKTIEDEKTMLREKLRKEKMKNRVMERNVKAEAVALARRIIKYGPHSFTVTDKDGGFASAETCDLVDARKNLLEKSGDYRKLLRISFITPENCIGI